MKLSEEDLKLAALGMDVICYVHVNGFIENEENLKLASLVVDAKKYQLDNIQLRLGLPNFHCTLWRDNSWSLKIHNRYSTKFENNAIFIRSQETFTKILNMEIQNRKLIERDLIYFKLKHQV